jgi:hypothetical protein
VAGMVSSSAQITELAPLMAYTASLKGAAIVSSSQQVQNYFTFAKTGSANTFYGNQSISGSSLVTGSVGIGTSTIYSGAKLHIVGGILAVEPTNGNTNSEILVGRGLSSLGTSAGSGITSKINFAFEGSNDNFYQELGFITINANQTRVNSAADFYISTKNAGASSPNEKLRLTNTGVLRLAMEGAGIQFNGDTAEANALHDYEEGTWTPTMTFGGGATSLTYNTQYGVYTKIGNVVHFAFRLILSNKGSSTGAAAFGGLPFTSANTNGNFGAVPVAFADAVVSFDKTLTWIVDPNATTINVRYCNGTNYADLNDTNFTNSSNIIASGTYRTA